MVDEHCVGFERLSDGRVFTAACVSGNFRSEASYAFHNLMYKPLTQGALARFFPQSSNGKVRHLRCLFPPVVMSSPSVVNEKLVRFQIETPMGSTLSMIFDFDPAPQELAHVLIALSQVRELEDTMPKGNSMKSPLPETSDHVTQEGQGSTTPKNTKNARAHEGDRTGKPSNLAKKAASGGY